MIAAVDVVLKDRICYRMHSPQWAGSPVSGAGAARQGGRLNRAGVEALYLATETQTAIAEYQQASSLLPPGTLVTYQISLDKVVDFSKGFSDQWDPLWRDLFCDWRRMVFAEKLEPPTWVISDLCQAEGYKGILFASTVSAGGTNLVVFTSALSNTDRLAVFDPNNALPKNQNSWI